MVARYRGRSRLLDEVCELCGHGRKYAIKLWVARFPSLAGPTPREPAAPLRGNGKAGAQSDLAFGGTALREALESGRAAVAARLRARARAARGGAARTAQMSAATMGPVGGPCRPSLGSRGRCRTRPGTLLRKQIPIRTIASAGVDPGQIERRAALHGRLYPFEMKRRIEKKLRRVLNS